MLFNKRKRIERQIEKLRETNLDLSELLTVTKDRIAENAERIAQLRLELKRLENNL